MWTQLVALDAIASNMSHALGGMMRRAPLDAWMSNMPTDNKRYMLTCGKSHPPPFERGNPLPGATSVSSHGYSNRGPW